MGSAVRELDFQREFSYYALLTDVAPTIVAQLWRENSAEVSSALS